MPAVRLVLSTPLPSPLQILRSATTGAFYPSCRGREHDSRRGQKRPAQDTAGETARGRRYASTAPLAWVRRDCAQCVPRQQRAGFGTVTPSRQTAFPRHGTAVAPTPPPPPGSATGPTGGSARDTTGAAVDAAAKAAASDTTGGPNQMTKQIEADKARATAEAVTDAAQAATEAIAAEAVAESTPDEVIALGPPTTPIAAILHGTGEGEKGERGETTNSTGSSGPTPPPHTPSPSKALLRLPLWQRQPPHLMPPPYVHHFDSYAVVRQLADSGYTQAQAITAMKAVRSLLGLHLAVAQASLVSRSDVENEAYLFKAACAELSMEVYNRRRRADEQTRQQRALLQHEVDSAAQSVGAELVSLTDIVRGLFDDRKMAVREEQKAAAGQIQTLNYKITIMLNSEMRSQVEALRWVLIRRSVLGIIFMVLVTLGSLRYASYRSQREAQQKRAAAEQARAAEKALLPDSAAFLTAN